MACASTLFPRTLLYCSNCGENVGTERITNLICSRKLGGCEGISIFHGSAARRAHGSSAEHAMRDLIASHAPLRTRRHKVRQNGPKHYSGDPTGAANRGPAKAQRSGFGGERRSSGTTELLPRKAKRRMWSLRRRGAPFSPIFLQTKKDIATGGRWFSSAAGENVKSKISSPKGVGKAARQVKTQNVLFFSL